MNTVMIDGRVTSDDFKRPQPAVCGNRRQ